MNGSQDPRERSPYPGFIYAWRELLTSFNGVECHPYLSDEYNDYAYCLDAPGDIPAGYTSKTARGDVHTPTVNRIESPKPYWRR